MPSSPSPTATIRISWPPRSPSTSSACRRCSAASTTQCAKTPTTCSGWTPSARRRCSRTSCASTSSAPAAAPSRKRTMYLIVAGGGKVGYYLTKTLVNEGYEVLLIEKDKKKVDIYTDRFGAVVVQGDACEASVLDA